jgi:hypothetical protein
MSYTLTPKRLVKYLNNNYDENYNMSEDIAKEVLIECNNRYDCDYTEEELIEVVEEYLEKEQNKQIEKEV